MSCQIPDQTTYPSEESNGSTKINRRYRTLENIINPRKNVIKSYR